LSNIREVIEGPTVDMLVKVFEQIKPLDQRKRDGEQADFIKERGNDERKGSV
jgi:hypothetical protein